VPVELEEIEIIGIKVIGLMRAGRLDPFKCSECNVELKKSRNCYGCSGDREVHYEEGIGQFYSCPVNFIPNSVHTFLDRYDFCEKYPNSSLPYSEVNPRYWEAVKVYDSFMGELRNNGKEVVSEKEEDAMMAKMESLFS